MDRGLDRLPRFEVAPLASWADLERAEPGFAERLRARLSHRKHCTLATLRADGSPRISGTEVVFDGGEILLGSMPGSRKARDLLRDPRLALHGPTEDPPEPPGPWDGEAKLAGLAVPIERHVAEGPPAEWFRLDIREAVLTWIGDPPDRLLIDSWHPERGLRRRERR